MYLCFVYFDNAVVKRDQVKSMAHTPGEPTQRVLEGWPEDSDLTTDLLVPAEFNHELFPVASTAVDPSERLLTFTLETVLPDGRVLERTLEVEGSPRLGLPGLFDQEVYAGIMALVERKGGMPADGALRFSMYELKEILRLPTNAGSYRRLRDSLLRWQRTSLTTQGAIYLSDTEEYATGEAYNIWSVRWARDSRPGRAKTELNEVKFHEYFIRNYQAGYLKSIDWDFLLSLGRGKRGGTLKRLYRLIDAQRAGTLEWSTTVYNLMSQVPVPPSYKYPGKARDFLERHHPELVERGFLESAEISDGYEVVYKIDPRFVSRQRHLQLADDPRDRAAIERLMSFKVREAAARKLVALRGARVCERYVDALPHQAKVRNKAGWLKTYIEGDLNGPFPPKDGFTATGNLVSETKTVKKPRTDHWLATTLVAGRNGYGQFPLHNEHGAAGGASVDGSLGDDLGALVGTTQQDAGRSAEGADLRRRREAGEFDAAISAFEQADSKTYARYVDTPSPVRADDTGNLYYVSLDGDLYLCPSGSTDEQKRAHITVLDRPDTGKDS